MPGARRRTWIAPAKRRNLRATAVEERLAELASARLHAESVKAHRQDVERALAQARTEETAAGEAVATAAAAAEDARRELGRAEQELSGPSALPPEQ